MMLLKHSIIPIILLKNGENIKIERSKEDTKTGRKTNKIYI